MAITNSAPLIDHCEIKSITENTDGGGVNILADIAGMAFPTITNCSITNNTAPSRAGLSVRASIAFYVAFSGCSITNNHTTSGGGGGVFVQSASPEAIIRFIDCEISGNTAQATNASAAGGGVFSQDQGSLNCYGVL